jgi:hypothetical protein
MGRADDSERLEHRRPTRVASRARRAPGASMSRLAVAGGVQRRYPDGSISTLVTSEGRIANGVLSGTWHDKFQMGQFQVSVGR